MKTSTPISILVFVTSLACFLGTAGAARQDAVRAAIAAQSQALMSALEQGDSARTADLFTVDARLSVPAIGGVLNGRAAIARFWQTSLDAGLKGLVLTATDLVGDGNLRVETGGYVALGAGRSELGRGQYLLVWMKDGGEWRICRDFAHADVAASSGASAANPDRVGFPRDYAAQFRMLGGTVNDDSLGLTTVYGNELAASVASSERPAYPNGSVILMEFAEPLRDGEDQLLRDARGQPLRGPFAHIDVMRRGAGYGDAYGASRAGEWEFASYRPDGSVLISSAQGARCAGCHLKAGAEKDFVYRKRSWWPDSGR